MVKMLEKPEELSELFYLLKFFSQSYLEQWNRLPNDFTPVWIDGVSAYCNVYSPIFFLLCILADCIDLIDKSLRLNEETSDILEDEIYTLIYYWMIEGSYNELFSKDKHEFFIGRSEIKIWLILSRLCKLALSYEDWAKYQLQDLSFEHFLKKYARPFDPSV